jgi:uncharacterized protein YbaP (TraB family)
MLKRTLILITILFIIGFTSTFAQNNPGWPKTFLWRISGNGLTKDSYLYGTMHLQDKRIFNLGDSLYQYMEKAEGYALEVDLSEMVDSLFQEFMDEEPRYRVDEGRMKNAKDKRKYIDSLVDNVKKRNDKGSRKILHQIREAKMNSILKKEMPTMMDAFLYGIARRQGKWLGGIEDVQDQLPLLDELGGDVTAEELLGPDKELKASLEKMISTYVSRDLDKIESYYLKDNSSELRNASLNKRNSKMASRIDSLAHIRSMFFTVGVAHLPGDLGVITLLRKKGFQLDPVYPTGEVDPMRYVSTLKSVEWERSSDANKTYEIEMPGKSVEVGIASDMVKMKCFVDFTTLTFFMATSSIAADDLDLDKLVDNTIRSQKAVVLSRKNIELNGTKGIETQVFNNDNYFKILYLRKRNRLYMLFVGGEKKEIMNSSDAEHFLTSFTPAKELPIAPVKTWKRFDLEEKGCSILFPGQPKINPKMPQGVVNSWNITTYDWVDPTTSEYYIFQIRDVVPGLHIQSDSSIFIAFRERLSESIKKVTLNEESIISEYPSLKYEGTGENGVVFKSLIINRGNRSYYVMVEGQNTTTAIDDMNNFLVSFNMLDYPYKAWNKQVQAAGNFQTLAPGPFIQKIDTSSTLAEKDRPVHFVSYDSLDCTSYEILKIKVSAYYSTTSDSAFFADIAASYRKATDSTLLEKWVTNGNLRGQEWIMSSQGNNNVQRSRLFLNGDTLYYILCYLPFQKINEGHYQKFFTDFRVISEDMNTSIYKRKIERILTDLQSKDSTIFSEASEAFSKAKFIASDKQLMEEALLKEFQDDASSGTNTRDKIFDTLLHVMDNGTLDFIRSKYAGLTGNREFIKLNLLNLLANYKTHDSYSLLKELLISNPPKSVGEYLLTYRITDSLELAKSLFPELLQLSNNPVMALRIMEIISVAIENKLIPVSMLDQYRNRFIYTADTLFDRLSRLDNISRVFLTTDMLNLMQQLKDAEADRILKKYLGMDNLEIKQSAIQNLLKNGQPVDPKQIEKVAADKSYRKDFYEQLHKMGKTAVFPAAYHTQQSIGEADVYSYSINKDYEPTEIKSLGVKTIKFSDHSYKIYLFRLLYEGKNDDGKEVKEYYLGISGPFFLDPKDLITESELTTIFFDEQYDPKRTEKIIQDHIKSVESGDKEE